MRAWNAFLDARERIAVLAEATAGNAVQCRQDCLLQLLDRFLLGLPLSFFLLSDLEDRRALNRSTRSGVAAKLSRRGRSTVIRR